VLAGNNVGGENGMDVIHQLFSKHLEYNKQTISKIKGLGEAELQFWMHLANLSRGVCTSLKRAQLFDVASEEGFHREAQALHLCSQEHHKDPFVRMFASTLLEKGCPIGAFVSDASKIAQSLTEGQDIMGASWSC
jgi:hypothetical protein